MLVFERSDKMEKTITIGGKEILMRATAATPMHYRNQFKKDMMVELAAQEGKDLQNMDLGVFERMAYIFSGAFKNGVSLEEWLEQFDEITALTEAIPDIMTFWEDNKETRMVSHPNAETVESSTQA